MMAKAIHRLVPKLRVSPLGLSPRPLRFELFVSMDDCEVNATKKRLPTLCMYDTREENETGATLAASPRGPKDGVHLTRGRASQPRA